MGIESEQLVFDYLSKVGDLAHGTSLTATERARLVGDLRSRIDRMRAEEGGAQSKAAVRRILSRLGKPEEVVSRAGEEEVAEPRHTPVDVGKRLPGQRTRRLPFRGRSTEEGESGPSVPSPRDGDTQQKPPGFPTSTGAAPPHLAGLDELGPEESDPDWWRLDSGTRGGPFDTGPYNARPSDEGASPGGSEDIVPGFVGGIELPEIWRQPASEEEPKKGPSLEKAPADTGVEQDTAESDAAETARRGPAGALRGLLRKRVAVGPRHGGIVELAAVVLLLAGAALGSPIALAVGWLAAWWAPKFSRTEAKWAALGMPGLVAIGTGVWLWGRLDGRWGEPLAEGADALGEVVSGALPVVLRVAAVASAVFLLWRARRQA
ncbi:hypothetical protein [Streptomyces sulphureus]|uniref:hypothetical protein n=1 Tax=Streptomyces sulphureus TaxID=47758 RepID=UPI0003738D67|nr:hypothetical protein [Streptomyces sulphureus]